MFFILLQGMHQGMWHYLIKAIDHSVITGQDCFVMDGKHVRLNEQVLGLQTMPSYFKEFKAHFCFFYMVVSPVCFRFLPLLAR